MAERNFANRTLFRGDNLHFLRGMNSGTVNLIATDPPFNKSRDFHATPDSLSSGAQFQDRWSWQHDVHDEWLVPMQRNEPEVYQVVTTAKAVYGDDMGAFLCWLGARVLEMHRILADDGTLYLHIDHTAHAWVKCLLDAIFGKQNFRNEIVWCYSGGGQPKRDFPRKHDTILRYTKSDAYVFNQNDVRVPYDSEYEATVFTSEGSRAPGRVYKPDPRGKVVEDWWRNIPRPYGKEHTGYPTQKPLALYERIVKASSKPGDMILDPFCGCATTPVAAERLGRQWVGMDNWTGAYQMVLDRLEKEGLASKGARRKGQQTLTFGDIKELTEPPKRTDSGETAAPLVLRMPSARAKALPPPRTHHGRLVVDISPLCQGCGADYNFDPRVLEVDHINPRSQGGSDAYDNLTLLCPPCNKEKRDRYTLIGLQDFNRKNGHMKNETNLRIGRSAGQRKRRGRR